MRILVSILLGCLATTLELHAAPQGGGSPLPPPVAPWQNPTTPEKAVLGKILFWEEQLSSDDTIACGTCHAVQKGFTDIRSGIQAGADGLLGTRDDLVTSPGVVAAENDGTYLEDPRFRFDPQLTGRRSPEIFAALYAPETFWDGRGSDILFDPETGLLAIPSGAGLESQALAPILNTSEMAHQGRDWDQVTAKLEQVRPMALATDLPPDVASALATDSTYPQLFQTAFGSPEISALRIAYALASYERTLIPDQTPWDAYITGDPLAMTPDQIEGWDQFNGPANCVQCHTPPFFTDNSFHNLGLRPTAEDFGRMDVTGNTADRGKFKTPSLRNAGLRDRFFHNGAKFALDNGLALGGVDDIYLAGGGAFPDNKDPLLEPLNGKPGVDLAKVFDFVGNGLTDPRVANALPPFDKPTLYSERFPDGAAAFGISQEGGDGEIPALITRTPGVVGGSSFKIGLQRAPGTAAVAILGLSRSAGTGGMVQGVPLNLDGPSIALRTATLQFDGKGFGFATFLIDLPSSGSLVGLSMFAQAFVEDPTAPGGVGAATL
ncbi:MAG: cytochrome-c peroxidase, partial [Planctomycetota bacterium]